MTPPRIAVIGGGVTGLAAAYELRDTADVTIFEATDRLGGKVLTDELDGIRIEAGPDSLLARDDAPIRLLEELGLAGDVVEPHHFGAWIATERGLKELPPGSVLGVPTSPRSIVRSGLLSVGGMSRAAMDLVLPKTRIDGDISVGRLVRARFGDQVADRLVAPLMSGVRSGDIDEMSLDMAAPQIASVAISSRSLMLGLRRATRRTAVPRFIGLKRGMASLVHALGDSSGAAVRLGTPVTRIGPDVTVDGEAFDGVVVAVPPHVARAILDIAPLTATRTAGVAVFNLVYPPGAVHPPPTGSGVLVPPGSRRTVIASTWFTSKWPHLAPPDGRAVIRCVAGVDASEEAVIADVAGLVEIDRDPLATKVHRWDPAFPVFEVGHRRAIAEAVTAMHGRPIRMAGAGYLATGLNDCIVHGRAAGRDLVSAFRA